MPSVRVDSPAPRRKLALLQPHAPVRGRASHVYYYITFVCNLRCRHCYVGDNLAPESHAPAEDVLRNAEACRRQGSENLILLGGEPTLHPDYQRILDGSLALGFRSVVVDTNGLSRDPLPVSSRSPALTVRFSLEGPDATTHDSIRGRGTFERALATLRRVVDTGTQTEVTLTIHRGNVERVAEAVGQFARLGVSRLNFHFVSLMGNGQRNPELELEPSQVLRVQRTLAQLRRRSPLKLRYPKLLVPKGELAREAAAGYHCGLETGRSLLIFPNGSSRNCPLEIDRELQPEPAPVHATANGCPLAHRLFPSQSLDSGLAVTCISWKGH